MSNFEKSNLYYHTVLSNFVPKDKPAFHEIEEQERVWGRHWGVFNDVGKINKILMHRPGDELKIITQDKYDETQKALIDKEAQWYFRSDKAPDIEEMQREHDTLAKTLKNNDVEIVYVDGSPTDPDAINVRDNGIVINGGVIVTRMGIVGKNHGCGRRGEEAYVTRKLAEIGMPILHTIQGEGLMEGGSFCLLDEAHAAIGLSYRGNKCATDQVRHILSLQGVELIEVPLTGYSLHIDGAIVMIDHDKALVNIERLPYWFIDKIKSLNIKPILTDHRDGTIGINCLTLSPGKVIVCSDAPWTAEVLSSSGIDVTLIKYTECRKKGGGIHCGTLPLVREKN